MPTVPPEIVVEIRSPHDEKADVDEKRDVFLAWGVTLVIVVDPEARSLEAYGLQGRHTTVSGDVYSPEPFPDLHFPLRAMFDELEIPDA